MANVIRIDLDVNGVSAIATLASAAQAVKQLTEASLESERASRQLGASALEAGVELSKISDFASRFAADARVSQTAATGLASEILKLAKAAGQLDKLDLIGKRVLDLRAARGLSETQLLDLLKAVRTGSDDNALNQAGFDDPGKLKDDFAKQINKSTAALTAQEQVLSRYNPLMKSAEIFTGANADAANALSGQIETANKTLTDLTTGFGNALTSSMEFREAIKLVGDGLKELGNYNIEDLRKRLLAGQKPEDIAKSIGNQEGTQNFDMFKNIVTVPFATVALISDVFTKPWDEATRNYKEAITGANDRRVKYLTESLTAEANAISQQNEKAAQVGLQKSLDDLRAASIEGLTKNQEAYIRQLEGDNLSGRKLKAAQEFFSIYRKEFAEKDTVAFTKQLQDNEKRYEASVKKITDLGKNATDFLRDLTLSSKTDNPFVSLFVEGERAAEKFRETTKGLSKELTATLAKLQQEGFAARLFETRLTGRLEAFDLRSEARDFRATRDVYKPLFNPSDKDLLNLARNDRGRYGEFLDKDGNFADEAAQKTFRNRFVVNAFASSQNIGDRSDSALLGLMRELNAGGAADDPARAVQDRLRDQIKIINDEIARSGATGANLATADRRLISLTQGLRPEDLTGNLGDLAAGAREREAVRLEQREGEKDRIAKETLEIQKKIADNGERLIKIAEEQGLTNLNVALENATGFDIEMMSSPAPRRTN